MSLLLIRCWAAVVVGLAALYGPGAAPTPVQVDPGSLDRYLSSSLEATGIPGMAVAVTRGPKVL